jgi:hypothetical protein
MALAPPSLSLSDIMHPMSPPRERPPSSPAAETLQDQDVAQMRARALQMGLGSEDATQSTPREQELFEMVGAFFKVAAENLNKSHFTGFTPYEPQSAFVGSVSALAPGGDYLRSHPAARLLASSS